MQRKSTERPDDDDPVELEESIILGVTPDGDCVYIHSFDDDIRALEFIEVMAAGFRADIMLSLIKRSVN